MYPLCNAVKSDGNMIIVHTKKQYDDNAAKRKKEKGLTEVNICRE